MENPAINVQCLLNNKDNLSEQNQCLTANNLSFHRDCIHCWSTTGTLTAKFVLSHRARSQKRGGEISKMTDLK